MNHKDLTNMSKFDLYLREITIRSIWTERKDHSFNKTKWIKKNLVEQFI